MAKNQVKVNANVVDTVRPRVAGAGRRPAVDALRSIATRVTAPLLPDDYLKLANPLWSARELRGRVIEVPAASWSMVARSEASTGRAT